MDIFSNDVLLLVIAKWNREQSLLQNIVNFRLTCKRANRVASKYVNAITTKIYSDYYVHDKKRKINTMY